MSQPAFNRKFKQVTVLLLAGGRGSRMQGADKGLLQINGQTYAAYIGKRFAQAGCQILVSANRNINIYSAMGWPCITDKSDKYAGPLAGLIAASGHIETDYCWLCPCDTPLIALQVLEKLLNAANFDQKAVLVPRCGQQTQFGHALLPTELMQDIQLSASPKANSLRRWLYGHPLREVDCKQFETTFLNVNSPTEISLLELSAHCQ